MNKKKLLTLTVAAVTLMTISGSAYAHTTSPSAAYQHDHAGKFANDELLKLLKVDKETLHKDLKAGKSLADIATEHGVSKQSVTDLLIKQSTARIQEAVKSGKMTQEKADQITAKLPEKMSKLVEKKGGFAHGKGHRHRGAMLKSAASALGMNVDDLKTELKSGKSLAEIASAKGKDKQALIDTMVSQASAKIDLAVKNGKMPQEKAQEIKAKLPERMKKMVERKDLCSEKKHENNNQKS